jgi:feruloyl esterase
MTSAAMVAPLLVTGPGGTANVSVPFCRVQGGSAFGRFGSFEVWLPPARRLERPHESGSHRVTRRRALCAHGPDDRAGLVEAGSTSATTAASGTWALKPEKVRDYGYRAPSSSPPRSRRSPMRSMGGGKVFLLRRCSAADGSADGGGSYPQLFDGIPTAAVDVLPRRDPRDRLAVSPAVPHRGELPEQPTVPTAKLNLVAAETVKACDANDGVVDGQITDPRSCTYDVAKLQCATASTHHLPDA